MKWIFVFALAFATQAFALDLNCMKKEATQLGLNQCSDSLGVYANQKLNQLISAINQKDPKNKAALLKLQATWKQYRILQCNYKTAGFKTGSIYPLLVNECYAKITWQQIDNLKILLCEGQGMTGECKASHQFDPPKEK